MVVGGDNYDGTAYNDVELLDLTEKNRTCRKPSNFPLTRYGAVGAYVENAAAVACGGFPITSGCSKFNPELGTWDPATSMIVERWFASSAFINGEWWISGGYDLLTSTEVLDSDSDTFVSYKDLPEGREQHNLVNINSSVVMMLGGADSYHADTYIFNAAVDGGTWIVGESLLVGRMKCQAGLVTLKNGTRAVVVAGGVDERTTEFFNLDTKIWSFGPDLPYDINQGASVQVDDTFLIAGGKTGSNYLENLIKFDTESESWIEMSQKLPIGRIRAAAFLVPDDYC